MTISSVGWSGAIAGGSASGSMDKEAFLRLLVLQLQNQDPLDPMDNQAMLAQLAQFSSLEEMQNLNESMLADLAATESVNNAIATSLIGKQVKAVGDGFTYDGEATVTLEYLLQSDGDVDIEVLDSDGRVVRTAVVPGASAGWHEFSWDGLDDTGRAMPAGDYRIRALQHDAQGNAVGVTTFVTGQVTGVRFDDGVTYLIVGDRRVRLSDVLEINAPDLGAAVTRNG
jgi:flagellar basal-body rod modification protein FlgD